MFNPPYLQILVLAAIAVFLILRLRDVLGTRTGHEPDPVARAPREASRPNLTVVEGGKDHDIIDHVPEGSAAAQALAEMKRIEPDFSVGDFIAGARSAYEMILMAFERGDMEEIKPFLSPDLYDAFQSVVAEREAQGLTIDANFIGVAEARIRDARFDASNNEGEIEMQLVAELTSVVRDQAGDIVEGNPNEIVRQKDVWTFARQFGSEDPNWMLVETGA